MSWDLSFLRTSCRARGVPCVRLWGAQSPLSRPEVGGRDQGRSTILALLSPTFACEWRWCSVQRGPVSFGFSNGMYLAPEERAGVLPGVLLSCSRVLLRLKRPPYPMYPTLGACRCREPLNPIGGGMSIHHRPHGYSGWLGHAPVGSMWPL